MPMLAAFASPASSIRLASDNSKVMDERGIVLVASLDPDFIRSDQASVPGMTTSAGISQMKNRPRISIDPAAENGTPHLAPPGSVAYFGCGSWFRAPARTPHAPRPTNAGGMRTSGATRDE